MKKFKIMFVCTGNICRSPLAHRVFEHQVMKQNHSALFHAESSGTGRWHVGENADPRMQDVARNRGVILDHIVRQLTMDDLLHYDLLLGMDVSHIRHLQRMQKNLPQEVSGGEIVLFRSYDPAGSGDVPDPYYGGISGFEHVYDIIERTTRMLLQRLLEKLTK